MAESFIKIEREQVQRARLLLEILARDQRVSALDRADCQLAATALAHIESLLWDQDDPLPETVYDPLPFPI